MCTGAEIAAAAAAASAVVGGTGAVMQHNSNKIASDQFMQQQQQAINQNTQDQANARAQVAKQQAVQEAIQNQANNNMTKLISQNNPQQDTQNIQQNATQLAGLYQAPTPTLDLGATLSAPKVVQESRDTALQTAKTKSDQQAQAKALIDAYGLTNFQDKMNINRNLQSDNTDQAISRIAAGDAGSATRLGQILANNNMNTIGNAANQANISVANNQAGNNLTAVGNTLFGILSQPKTPKVSPLPAIY